MDPISEFRAAVAGQLWCRQAESEIMPELLGHIADSAEVLISRGCAQEEAEAQAVAAMGDPAELGKALNALHSPWWYWAVWVSLRLTAAALGIATVVFFLGFLPGRGQAPLFPTMTAEEAQNHSIYNGWNTQRTDFTVLSRGVVTGGGRLRDYTFSPAGEAVLYRLQLASGESDTLLCFLVNTWHWQPWLGDFQHTFPQSLSGSDGTGVWEEYRMGMQSAAGGGILSGYQRVTALGVGPETQTFDVTLDLYGESVSFHVEFGEEGVP